ncbi:MAG TPA: bifunctional glutamate N-acetyltransferase/amino-acid acetyltransferase ArgJ [Desulfobacteraceae bacterium]|nr:bifunctional glutamate N-acetyltransferase/amino-acid acetyltransferase ArgJ [Desulfobacteraceae bacterium]
MDSNQCVVKGFSAGAVEAGIKKKGGTDLALIFADRPCAAAGVFTTNRVKAAPVLVSMERIGRGTARAVLANSGNANACTGASGPSAARKAGEAAASALGIDPEEILLASTGVIGAPLDASRIEQAMPSLVGALRSDGLMDAARAIMTTDSFPKISVFEGESGGHSYRIAGIAKGAGMIMPQMATMLCFVISDIHISSRNLQKALVEATGSTFNRITVDGDTSTNDTVIALASGAAGNADLDRAGLEVFGTGLTAVLNELARMVVKDGEGATKTVHVEIRGAVSAEQAERAARTVANSSLVKTAFYGQDPNWGRILAALGRSGIDMNPDLVDIRIDSVEIVSRGMTRGEEAEAAGAERMKNPEFSVVVDLHIGPFSDRMLTCDLTHDYVSINADYRT